MLPIESGTDTVGFESAGEAAARLYRQSQKRRWEVAEIPWELGLNLNERQRRSGARVLSQVLFGEQASFKVIEQMLPMVTEPEAQRFLVSQAQDEARHVEVFSRYIGLLGEVQPPGENLTRLVEGMLELPTVEAKLIGMHILIEGMALETFHAIALHIDDPLLREILHRVFRDESRHVAFGTAYTRQVVARLGQPELEELARQGGRFAAAASDMIHEERASAAEFGLDLLAVQSRTLRVLFRRLTQIGLLNTLDLF